MKQRRRKRALRQRRRESKKVLARQALIRRLGGIPQMKEFLGRQTARREELERDQVFVLKTEKLQNEFGKVYSYNPQAIDSFLDRFGRPPFSNIQEIQKSIKTLPAGIKDLLDRYIRYASRFGVYFVHRNEQFEWRLLSPSGRKFHVKQVKGRLAVC